MACGQTASGRAINFTIDSVPDSLVQQGVFADYFDSGALLSSLIKIDPGAAVTVEVLLQIDWWMMFVTVEVLVDDDE